MMSDDLSLRFCFFCEVTGWVICFRVLDGCFVGFGVFLFAK